MSLTKTEGLALISFMITFQLASSGAIVFVRSDWTVLYEVDGFMWWYKLWVHSMSGFLLFIALKFSYLYGSNTLLLLFLQSCLRWFRLRVTPTLVTTVRR